jgi:hypothetical protein
LWHGACCAGYKQPVKSELTAQLALARHGQIFVAARHSLDERDQLTRVANVLSEI